MGMRTKLNNNESTHITLYQFSLNIEIKPKKVIKTQQDVIIKYQRKKNRGVYHDQNNH